MLIHLFTVVVLWEIHTHPVQGKVPAEIKNPLKTTNHVSVCTSTYTRIKPGNCYGYEHLAYAGSLNVIRSTSIKPSYIVILCTTRCVMYSVSFITYKDKL